VAKTVAGFLNFEGGALLIGVADDGTVIGIENDMATLSRQDVDGFEQTLRQVLSDYLGPEYNHYIRSAYEQRNGQTVAVLRVEQSAKPVYLRDGDKAEFYVRAGNTTRPLDIEAAYDYIQMHWEAQ
jgi:predicted HTH transcriptional regulator